MNRIFSGDNVVFRFCERLFDLVILSALWTLLCIPIITIGPATTALYYSVVKCVRHNERGTLSNFFTCFKQNFKVGAIAGSLAVICGLMLAFSRSILALMTQAGSTSATLLYYAEAVFIVLVLGLACWLFPILSRFTVPLGGLFASTLQLGFKHLPTTIIVGLLVIESAQFTLTYLYALLFAPGLVALLASLFFERVFLKYTPDTTPPADEDDEDARPWYLQK